MRVLVATDLSETADAALREGASLVTSLSDCLAVIHVVPSMSREGFFHSNDDILEARSKQVIDRARSLAAERVDRVVSGKPELFIDEGVDYAGIILRAESWKADLIVVGSQGHSRLASLMGGVTSKVVRNAHCSVLVARPGDRAGGVLAATDLSDASLKAVSAAALEARRRGVALKVVHSVGFVEIEAYYLLELASPSINRQTPERARILHMMHEALAKARVEAECELLDPPAAAAIVREAEATGAQLVVVGMHGRTGLARLGLGSVAEKVVAAAPCSVLVVR